MIKSNGASYSMARPLCIIVRTNGVPIFTSHEAKPDFHFASRPLIQAIQYGCERIDADLSAMSLVVTHNLVSS
jgi:hypothetical protein